MDIDREDFFLKIRGLYKCNNYYQQLQGNPDTLFPNQIQNAIDQNSKNMMKRPNHQNLIRPRGIPIHGEYRQEIEKAVKEGMKCYFASQQSRLKLFKYFSIHDLKSWESGLSKGSKSGKGWNNITNLCSLFKKNYESHFGAKNLPEWSELYLKSSVKNIGNFKYMMQNSERELSHEDFISVTPTEDQIKSHFMNTGQMPYPILRIMMLPSFLKYLKSPEKYKNIPLLSGKKQLQILIESLTTAIERKQSKKVNVIISSMKQEREL